MSMRTYLVKAFNFKHENSFFRLLSKELTNKYKNSDELSAFIGNISCNGHEIDALFISKGKIIVIDFKDYGGFIQFSENNPWRISKEGDFTFVKGGGGIRNPYQQVNAYRHSLIQFLGNSLNEIRDTNHLDIDLGHINAMVLFHQPIKIDKNTIPHNISKYFDIADVDTYIGKISDNESKKLNFSVMEIEKILIKLDINASNIYNFDANEVLDYTNQGKVESKTRSSYLYKLLNKQSAPKSQIEKYLTYYKLIVELEKFKNQTISNEFNINIDLSSCETILEIDFDKNPKFKENIYFNRNQQYPKNIFIALMFKLYDQYIPLLQCIIPASDFDDSNEILMSDFTLCAKPLEDKEMPDDTIDEMHLKILKKKLLSEKIEILKSYLGEELEVKNNVTFALSEDSPYTVQLLSEIRKMITKNLVKPDGFVDNFLLLKPTKRIIKQIPTEDFIQITPLNREQKRSVECAFNQSLSVITGPPGTGKTQVVLNILANAVIQNKKILLASKNNMAIDNVKERLAKILEEPDYFLRFGNKKEIKETTLPILQQFLMKIRHNIPNDRTVEINSIKLQIAEKRKIIKTVQSKLDMIPVLKEKIQNSETEIRKMEEEVEDWRKSNKIMLGLSKTVGKNLLHNTKSSFTIQKNEVVAKNSGLSKLLFSLLHKKKLSFKLLNLVETLPSDCNAILSAKQISISLPKLINADAIISAYNQLIILFQSGIDLIDEEIHKIQRIEEKLTQLKKIKTDLAQLHKNEAEFYSIIEINSKEIDNFGPALLNASINNKIMKINSEALIKFSSFIPDRVPWKDEEIIAFKHITSALLESFNICTVTSLSIANSIPLCDEIFDIVVIDEASQCDIASALPLIYRCKQLVVIGDPLQLKHISKMKNYEEEQIIDTIGINSDFKLDYINNSLYDYCFNWSAIIQSEGVFIKEHFRCHPEIINYSNNVFYGPKMGQELDVKTNVENLKLQDKGIFWIHVSGHHDEKENINKDEVIKTIEIACELAKKNPNTTIGITTPFSAQAKLLNSKIPGEFRNIIKAATVHKFQGDEKDIMIFSPVVTFNTPKSKSDWMNRSAPYLINVAVTRAKSSMYIVGNFNSCQKLNPNYPLYKLAEYVETLGKVKK